MKRSIASKITLLALGMAVISQSAIAQDQTTTQIPGIGMPNNSVFLSSMYLPVTERILELATENYIRAQGEGALSQRGNDRFMGGVGGTFYGGTTTKARKEALRYMEAAGIDGPTARLLAQQIQAGNIKVSRPELVVSLLSDPAYFDKVPAIQTPPARLITKSAPAPAAPGQQKEEAFAALTVKSPDSDKTKTEESPKPADALNRFYIKSSPEAAK